MQRPPSRVALPRSTNPAWWGRVGAAFAGALLILAAITAVNVASVLEGRTLSGERTRMRELLLQIGKLRSALQDAETGQRGFLLTGDEADLGPYHSGLNDVQVHLAAIDRLDDQYRTATFDISRVRPLIAERLSVLADGLSAYRAGGVEAALPIIRSGHGKAVMDDVRRVLNTQQEEIQHVLDERSNRADANSRRAIILLVAGTTVSTFLVAFAFVWLRREVADRRTAEASLSRILDASLDAICSFDAEGRFVQASAGGERVWGYRPEELLGTPYIDKVVPEDREKTVAMAATIMAGAPTTAFENRYQRKDGTVAHVMWSAQWSSADQVMFCVARDITEMQGAREAARRHAETLERTLAELVVARDRAEAADRLKSAFLATMSHELRTPLNAIIGFTGILLQGLAGPLNAEQQTQLGMVQGSARHLLALINDVLDISKIEAGELKVGHAPFDLRAVIDRALGVVRPSADAKGLRLTSRLDPRIGAAVGDARRVEQILLNLLNNAVKFTSQGEVTLTADLAEGECRMQVIDTGIGIAADDLATLFEPFRQIDTGLARNHEGTGLGLAICQRLAHLLGGRIHAASRPGEGSVFSVNLPVNAPVPS